MFMQCVYIVAILYLACFLCLYLHAVHLLPLPFIFLSPLEFGFNNCFKNKVNEILKSTFSFVGHCLLSTSPTKCEQKEAK